MRKVVLVIGAALIGSAQAAERSVGSWGKASAPKEPCLVVTNGVTWTLSDGKWCPAGCWAKDDSPEKRTDFSQLVPCPPPNWKKIRALKRYLGVWKLISEKSSARCPDYLKIRSDLLLVSDLGLEFSKSRRRDRYSVSKLRACEGGLRVEPRSRHGEPPEPFDEYVDGFWVNPKGELVRYTDAGIRDVYVRTDEAFADPVDARKELWKSGKISGTWGVNVEFTTFVLSFCEDGRGLMSGFMQVTPFRWKRDKKGLHCSLEADFAELSGLDWTEFDCLYDVEQDRLTVQLPAEALQRRSKPPTELPRMPGVVTKEQMDALSKQMEDLRQDPQFKMLREMRTPAR